MKVIFELDETKFSNWRNPRDETNDDVMGSYEWNFLISTRSKRY